MFNIQGSELIFLLLVALVILGPEKLPDAVRKFTKAYTEFRKMANGFQGELKQVLDEPMRELRETADAMRDAKLTIDDVSAYVRDNPRHYNRALVALSDHYELLVMTWRPGQVSAPHDHAGSIHVAKLFETGTDPVFCIHSWSF